MIEGLKPYPSYRSSGVPWLGQVPNHWSTFRFKNLSDSPIKNGVGEAAQPWRGDWPRYIRTSDILGRRSLRANTVASLPPDVGAAAMVEVGDLLFSAAGSIGKVYWHSTDIGPACFAGFLVRLRPNGIVSPAFLSYWAESPPFQFQVAVGAVESTIQNFSAGKYRALQVVLPPMVEQEAATRFLDYAVRRIQNYILGKQTLIKLLEEQRQAIVDRAVTRGVDPTPSLKPSGIAWLGDVPAHWGLVRSKRLFSARKDLALPDDVQLSATQAYGVIPQSEFEEKAGRRVVKISLHLEKRRHVERDDFVISMRSFQGGLERAWASGAIRSSYVVLKPSLNADAAFFAYLFKSRKYIRALQSTADFIRDGQDLNFDNFCGVDLPLVPLDEQKAIAGFIAKTTMGIDATIVRTRREIALMQEFRAQLTADIVTGKLDVREAAARLPSGVEDAQSLQDISLLDESVEETADDFEIAPEEVTA